VANAPFLGDHGLGFDRLSGVDSMRIRGRRMIEPTP